MTSTTATSFESFLSWLNNARIVYFIPWGYEGLPRTHTGGDVDICVHSLEYSSVAKELASRGYVPTKCPRYDKLHHQHEYFASQNQWTIDMFDTFCFPYEGKTVVLDIEPDFFRRISKGYYPILPSAEALFTALRVIGGRKDCAKRLEKYFV